MYTKRQARFMDSSIKAEFADGEQHLVDEMSEIKYEI